MLTKQEAESMIVALVEEITATRLLDIPANDKTMQLEIIEAEIAELKEITGPRKVTGTMLQGGAK